MGLPYEVLRVALPCATIAAAGLPARAAVELTPLDRSRLADIKRITNAKTEQAQWRTLLSYFKAGPSTKVRLESANALARACDLELKKALVKIATDEKGPSALRFFSTIALGGSVRYLTDEDIEAMLASDEKMGSVFVPTLTDLAPGAELSLEQVKRIIEKYDDGPANVRGNRNVGVVGFVGGYLAHHRADRLSDEVRPVLTRFLLRCAHSAGAEPRNLRPSIGRVMAENKVPGAVEVLIESLKDDLAEAKRCGRPYEAGYLVALLGQVAGASVVTENEKKSRNAPDGPEIARRWLAWWEQNRSNPGYRLPPAETADGQ
jgi:hypothetical protein